MTSGMHLLFAMIAPLSKPQAAPVTRPASTAIKVGRPLSNTTYITTPQTTIILPMDRSIPPEISRMLIAIVRIPSTQICWKIATMLLMPIKLGLIHEIITTINAITIARRTRWSLKIFLAGERLVFLSEIFIYSQ